MHHQPKRPPSNIHWNILTWDCRDHGPHRVIIAGLDPTADLVSDIISRFPMEDDVLPHLHRDLIPVDDARSAAHGVSHDNLPL